MIYSINRERNKLIAILILAFVIFGIYIVREVTTPEPVVQKNKTVDVMVGGGTVVADVADTDSARVQGLSGRKYIAPNTGMLFVYSASDRHPIWMKGMNFSLDIVWIGVDKSILYIEKNASPDSFPSVFDPPVRALYILELPAGFSTTHNLKIGDFVTFSL